MWPHGLRFDPKIRDFQAPHVLMLEQVYQRADEFDVIHSHLDYWSFSLLRRQSTPFVVTLHGRLDLPELRPLYNFFPDVPLVTVSDAQRLPLPQANFVATVLHGLPEDLLTPRPLRPSYLAFLGRISPEKRPDRAIRIARLAGIPLKIAAKIDRADDTYFHNVIRPMIDGRNVELIGEITDAEKSDFLSGAIALLMPIDWPEPFGLAMIEAMACGTPVIAFNHGSVQEVVEPGVTGLIVDNEMQAVAAIEQAARLPRDMVRHRFAQRFSAQRMAQDYLALYRRLTARGRHLRAVG
jgi:glycosyltransferase involved in cell wall biosynthesis